MNELLSEAIELKPESADNYNARGLSKSRSGDKRGAINDYKQAIKLDPNEKVYSENLASVEDWLKSKEQAEKRKAIKKKSIKNTKVTNTDYNSICLKAQDYNGCMKYYKKKGECTGRKILRAIGAGLSGVNLNSSGYQSRPSFNGASSTPTLTPYNPKPPTFQKYSNEYNQMWNPR